MRARLLNEQTAEGESTSPGAWTALPGRVSSRPSARRSSPPPDPASPVAGKDPASRHDRRSLPHRCGVPAAGLALALLAALALLFAVSTAAQAQTTVTQTGGGAT